MAWIKTIKDGEVVGQLKKIYKKLISERGKVSNIMKIQSLNPSALKAHLELYMNLMFESSDLKREERELIAVVVSSVNGCKYCMNHHGEALNHYWKDRSKIEKLWQDYKSLEFSEKIVSMIEYAVKLTKNLNEISQTDVVNLQKNGFTDGAVLDINLIVSYFNFVNRIALGLGVNFTPTELNGYKY